MVTPHVHGTLLVSVSAHTCVFFCALALESGVPFSHGQRQFLTFIEPLVPLRGRRGRGVVAMDGWISRSFPLLLRVCACTHWVSRARHVARKQLCRWAIQSAFASRCDWLAPKEQVIVCECASVVCARIIRTIAMKTFTCPTAPPRVQQVHSTHVTIAWHCSAYVFVPP